MHAVSPPPGERHSECACYDNPQPNRWVAMPPFPANTRKYFVHAAHRSIGVSSATAAFKACDPARFGAAEPDGRRLVVALFAAPETGGAAQKLPMLARYLRLRLDARCIRPDDRPVAADVAVLLADDGAIGARLIEHIGRHCAEGGGVVVLGIAATPCRAERAFQWDVLGAELREPRHALGGPVELVPAAAGHPAVRGMARACAPGDSPISAARKSGQSPSPASGDPAVRLADDAEVLLVARRGRCVEPVVWVRRFGLGRVFSTTLRPGEDLRLEDFLRLVEPAVLWAAGRQPPPD